MGQDEKQMLDSEDTILLPAFDENENDSKKEIQYLLDYCTDAGIRKKVNQDACCVRILKTASHTIVLAVVCDGVGGMYEGEYASKSTISAFYNWFDYGLPKIVTGQNEETLFEVLSKEIKTIIDRQNHAVFSYAEQKGIQIGTTLTAMLFVDQDYLIAQIGDSRAYRVSSDVMQLTEDQSFVAEEVRAGRMTKKEAKHDKRRNIILQCLGATPHVMPECVSGKVQSGVSYFLCSDGFVHELENEEIENIMAPSKMNDLTRAHEHLVEAVNLVKERGEKDNITVVLVRT